MITVDNVSKSYGTKLAVDQISFEVVRGEVLGFIGPNGSGKSTTMRMITGFIPPSSGRITVGGHDMVTDPIPGKRLIGYLPESAPSYGEMTVVSFLRFVAELRGLRGDAKRRELRRVVDLCALESVLGQTIDTLSKGFRHRTSFAQALIHDPDVLILDEPTDGLDPNQKHEMRALIRRMGERKAIVFSTHILEEVDEVCSRAIIIDRGRIVANGTPDQLRARSAHAGTVSLRIAGPTAESIESRLAQLPMAFKTAANTLEPGLIELRVQPQPDDNPPATGAALAAAIAEIAAREGWRVESLNVEPGRLDEVFRSLTRSDTAQPQHERVSA